LSPYKTHAFVRAGLGNGLGLSREEAPLLTGKDSAALQHGDVLTLRVGATDSEDDNAIASAMVVVGESGADIIWK